MPFWGLDRGSPAKEAYGQGAFESRRDHVTLVLPRRQGARFT